MDRFPKQNRYDNGIQARNTADKQKMKCNTQCLMAHEDTKVKKKRKCTIDAIGEVDNYIWQTNSEEILYILDYKRVGDSDLKWL